MSHQILTECNSFLDGCKEKEERRNLTLLPKIVLRAQTNEKEI